LAQGEKTTCTGFSGKCGSWQLPRSNNCRSECCSCRRGQAGCYDSHFKGYFMCT